MRDFLKKYPQFWVLAIICLLASAYFNYVFVGTKHKIGVSGVIETKVEQLESDKKKLNTRIDSLLKITDNLLHVVDSIENIKPKIRIKYVEKYRQIDSSNSLNLSKEFDSIFAVHHVK